MSKIELSQIGSGYASVPLLNNNFQAIEDALNNSVLYRVNPEEEPNAMSGDLDMNGMSVINHKIKAVGELQGSDLVSYSTIQSLLGAENGGAYTPLTEEVTLDLDDMDNLETGFYRYRGDSNGRPFGTKGGYILHLNYQSTDAAQGITQVAFENAYQFGSGAEIHIRHKKTKAGSWTEWYESSGVSIKEGTIISTDELYDNKLGVVLQKFDGTTLDHPLASEPISPGDGYLMHLQHETGAGAFQLAFSTADNPTGKANSAFIRNYNTATDSWYNWEELATANSIPDFIVVDNDDINGLTMGELKLKNQTTTANVGSLYSFDSAGRQQIVLSGNDGNTSSSGAILVHGPLDSANPGETHILASSGLPSLVVESTDVQKVSRGGTLVDIAVEDPLSGSNYREVRQCQINHAGAGAVLDMSTFLDSSPGSVTVGKTGSGMDIEWVKLDEIPAGETLATVDLIMTLEFDVASPVDLGQYDLSYALRAQDHLGSYMFILDLVTGLQSYNATQSPGAVPRLKTTSMVTVPVKSDGSLFFEVWSIFPFTPDNFSLTCVMNGFSVVR